MYPIGKISHSFLSFFFNFDTSRADTDGLSEQKRLEGLITRYKSMIPVIETTMIKIEVYSRSYAFRSEVQEVTFSYVAIFL